MLDPPLFVLPRDCSEYDRSTIVNVCFARIVRYDFTRKQRMENYMLIEHAAVKFQSEACMPAELAPFTVTVTT